MKAKINKPCRVNILSGDVEISEQEWERLSLLGLLEEKKAEPKEKPAKTEKPKKPEAEE